MADDGKPNRDCLSLRSSRSTTPMLPLSWLVIRVAVGWNLFVHGYSKILIGPTDGIPEGFADIGFRAAGIVLVA